MFSNRLKFADRPLFIPLHWINTKWNYSNKITFKRIIKYDISPENKLYLDAQMLGIYSNLVDSNL